LSSAPASLKSDMKSIEGGSLFVLSGEELTLPYGEIDALICAYSKGPSIERYGNRVVHSSLSAPDLIETVTQRSAYCRFGGSFLSISKDLPSLATSVEIDLSKNGKTFAVASFSLDMEKCGELGAVIKTKTRGKVSLENPDYVFDVESVPDGYIIGVSSKGYKEFHWRDRRPRARKFFLPSAIYPKLARCLVNLSRVKEGEFFVDPFCGTGSLLIESSLMGMRTVGIEITRWIARGASLNMKGFSLPYEAIIRSSSAASALPLTEVDAIATDVPYGRASSTKGMSTKEILERFLSAAWDSMHSSLSKKKYCVVMHPSTINLEEIISSQRNSFQLKEQHLLYVHRNLTRVISVLGRT
jgi:tRNA (guanine10-N2)-dimethyltransferase